MHSHKLAGALVVALFGVTFTTPASAQQWPDDAREANTAELAGTAFFTVGAFVLGNYIVPLESNLSGGIVFDDPIRDGLRLTDRGDREAASRVSDVLLWTLMAYPLLDTAGVALIAEDEFLARQMLVINALAYSTMGLLNQLTKNLVGRQRPSAEACENDPDYAPSCGEPEGNRSFFSGHTGFAFTAASLTCLEHGAFETYGGAGDTVACASSLALATGVGLLRVLADRHYLSDVLVGAALGVLVGLVMPAAIHNLRP